MRNENVYGHKRCLESLRGACVETTLVKVRVDPFFRDLDQFTILLPVKDLSSVHNPYFLAMKNMIVIRSRSFFLKQKIENIVEI